jgi:PAS domain S-box-containing protein
MGVGVIEGTLGRISLRMASTLDVGEVLSEITRGLVDDLEAALARIWLLGPGDLCKECIQAPQCADRTACLHLAASAGLSEHLDGTYRRIPLGALKIGWIAETREPVCTNDVLTDPRIADKEWAQREGIRSFAGYPLDFRGEVLGVLAMFARRTLLEAEFERLGFFAAQAASALRNARLYRELQVREWKIRRLVDANVVGVTIATEDGQVVEANEAFLEMVGCTRDDLDSGRIMWTELTPPEWQGASQRAVAQLRTTGSADLYEKEYFRKDGSRVPVLVAAAALEGSPVQAVAFVVDLTERKQAEVERERLRRLQADLARISRITTMGEITASLAHEIRQPITAASTNAAACVRFLGREHPNVAKARVAAEEMLEDTYRAAEIIRRVSSLYRKGTPQRQPVDANEVALETLALLRTEAEQQGVSLRTELASDLPRVAADRVQLQQVFMNLMLNAIEAMQGTGVSSLSGRNAGGTVSCCSR